MGWTAGADDRDLVGQASGGVGLWPTATDRFSSAFVLLACRRAMKEERKLGARCNPDLRRSSN